MDSNRNETNSQVVFNCFLKPNKNVQRIKPCVDFVISLFSSFDCLFVSFVMQCANAYADWTMVQGTKGMGLSLRVVEPPFPLFYLLCVDVELVFFIGCWITGFFNKRIFWPKRKKKSQYYVIGSRRGFHLFSIFFFFLERNFW